MQVCVDTSWVCLQCTSVFMYRCKCISVCYLLLGRWACTLSMLSWPALQRVDPCVKWKVARPLLLLLHTLWQDTLNGQEIMFDPAAGQRGSQFGFKPAHNTNKKKKKTLGASLWWQHTGQISLWTLNIFYVYPPDTLHGKLQIHYRLKKECVNGNQWALGFLSSDSPCSVLMGWTTSICQIDLFFYLCKVLSLCFAQLQSYHGLFGVCFYKISLKTMKQI